MQIGEEIQNQTQPAAPEALPAIVQNVAPAPIPAVAETPAPATVTAQVNPVPENQPEVPLEKKPAPKQFKIIPNLEDLLRDEKV